MTSRLSEIGTQAPRPANVVDQIQSRLEVLTDRVGQATSRVHSLWDQVTGPRPSPLSEKAPGARVLTLLDRVDQLENAVGELESALSRSNA